MLLAPLAHVIMLRVWRSPTDSVGLPINMAAPVGLAPQSNDPSLTGHDEEQIRLMEERCIVTDKNDNMLRDGSKKECACLVLTLRPPDGQYQPRSLAPGFFCVSF